jgi:hypothetical protein
MNLIEEFIWTRHEISLISLAIRGTAEKYKTCLDAMDFIRKRVYTYPSKEAYMGDIRHAREMLKRIRCDLRWYKVYKNSLQRRQSNIYRQIEKTGKEKE